MGMAAGLALSSLLLYATSPAQGCNAFRSMASLALSALIVSTVLTLSFKAGFHAFILSFIYKNILSIYFRK